MKESRRCRLAILSSHPIQYFTPIYRLLAARPEIDLEVMFFRDFGVKSRFDKQFGQAIRWDTDQLSGYRSRFLTNISPIADTFNPLHAINPGAFFRLLRSYDAVWLNGYAYPSNWLAAAAASIRRVPILFRSDMRLTDNTTDVRKHRLRETIIHWWMRRSAALLYIGEANRQAYLHYGATEEQLFFCPFSVDVEFIEMARKQYTGHQREGLREKWGLPTHGPIILFVGKLIPRKHPEVLLQIAAIAGSSAHVVFAGSGPMESELKRQAAADGLNNVTFLGFVNQSRLPDVYALSDVFVMPSEDEPWGLVLNEAMAAGIVPVVSDHVGAHHDLISEDETGYVVPVGATDAMVTRVLSLLRDDELRRRVGAAARERSAAYSYDASTDGIVAALRAIGSLRPAETESGSSLAEM